MAGILVLVPVAEKRTIVYGTTDKRTTDTRKGCSYSGV